MTAILIASYTEAAVDVAIAVGVTIIIWRYAVGGAQRQRVLDRLDQLVFLVDPEGAEPPYQALARIHERRTARRASAE